MKLIFQRNIAKSQATLPVVGVIALVLWFVLPTSHLSPLASLSSCGLWCWVPPFLQEGYWGLSISLFCAALAVYIMAELNNAYVLLRVSSRMLSSTLALLLALVVSFHRFQPGSLLLLFYLLSLFPLFASYQMPSPLFSFLTHLMAATSSLVFPMLLWTIPLYWIAQAHFRTLTWRCFIASLLGILVPYWLYGGVAIITDSLNRFVAHVSVVAHFQWADYTQLNLCDVLVFVFVLVLFVSGTIDYFINRFYDKTRVRLSFNMVVIHGIGMILFIALQPQYVQHLLPLLLIDTAMVFGHFFTLTHTKFTHIYSLILLVLALALVAIQSAPQLLLGGIGS